jgi:hypothetical protein
VRVPANGGWVGRLWVPTELVGPRGGFGRFSPLCGEKRPRIDENRRSTRGGRRPNRPTQPEFAEPVAVAGRRPAADGPRPAPTARTARATSARDTCALYVSAIAAIPPTTTTAPTTRAGGTRSCASSAAAAVAITTLVSRSAATGAASAISSAASAIA